MSRRTRKEKIAAEQRRRQMSNESPDRSVAAPMNSPSINNLPKYEVNISTIINGGDKSADQTSDSAYGYVVNDLKRIGFLTLLAFCAQVVLWYFLGRT